MSHVISVGGSISTGSSPWIDILASNSGFRSAKGELRLGDSGLYSLVSKIYVNEIPSPEEMRKVRSSLVEYGKEKSLTARIIIAVLSRVPGLPKGIDREIAKYRAGDAGRRGYDKLISGFSNHSAHMLDELIDLVERADLLDDFLIKNELKKILSEYLCLLLNKVADGSDVDEKIIVDKLFAPKYVFDKTYGVMLPRVFDNVKFVVVRRDPRDQFIDLVAKKRNGYNIVDLEAASNKFVESYLRRYDRMERLLKTCDSNRVHALWFEDIVYDLDPALLRLEEFIVL